MGQRQTKRQKEIVDRENKTKADKETEGDRRQRKMLTWDTLNTNFDSP